MMSSISDENASHYSTAIDEKLLELVGLKPAADPASAELTIEELQRQNEQLRQYVVKLLDESDRLKQQLTESERENCQLQSRLSSAEAVDLEHYGVLEL
jgi:predicted RNase H-like nuclease (RuvC/YqgF family)